MTSDIPAITASIDMAQFRTLDSRSGE